MAVTVTPSGFPWEDVELRWLARTETHFAYAATEDGARAELAALLEVPA